MQQDTNIAVEEVKKPRKRFVGRAKKAASTETESGAGAIEDGAVGFASNSDLFDHNKLFNALTAFIYS